MNEVLVKFVTDTGCPVTIINEQTFCKLGAKYSNVNSRQKIQTANGSESRIRGYANIKLRLQTYEATRSSGRGRISKGLSFRTGRTRKLPAHE